MVKCNICSREFQNNKGISYHFRIAHNLDYIKYLIENKLIKVPKCLNCGKDILTKRGRAKILNNTSELKYCSNKCKLTGKEYRKKMSVLGKKNAKYITHRTISDSEKRKKAITTKKSWEDDDVRASRIKNMKLYKNTEEHNLNISKALTGIKRTDEYKNNMSKIISDKYINGEFLSNKIKYNSTKNNKFIYCMSSYEFKFCVYLDMNDDIINWKYQPFYLVSEKNKRYIPDFYYEDNSGNKYLVEIDRYKGYKEKYGYKWKLELAEKHCKENNIIFLYLDINDINNMWMKKFVLLDINAISLSNQENNDFISKYLSELFTLSRLGITIPPPELNSVNLDDSKELDTVSNRKFSTNNSEFLLSFYPNYWNCKWRYSRFSPTQSINYKTTFETILGNLIKRNKNINAKEIIKQIRGERYSISFFPDCWASWIYSKFLPNSGQLNILDICGGFGGRLLGFKHFIESYKITDYNYTYIDINKETCKNSENLVKYIDLNNIKIINNRFEVTDEIFNKNYDLIFTSIPYYDLEIYNDINLKEIYKTEEMFIVNFINKVFDIKSKHIILNVSSKYSKLLENKFINTKGYRLDNLLKIELSKHPFQKKNNVELFYVYKPK